jgi:hypothetical protein
MAQGDDVVWSSQFTFYGDNTEFFTPFRYRQTLLGQQFKSYMNAPVLEKVDLWAGLFLDHESASNQPVSVNPILSFVYHDQATQFIFGALQQVYRHGLIEPMEVTSLELTRPIEYGLEFVQSDGSVQADAFLNWQDVLSATQREIFDYGGSGQWILMDGLEVLGQCHGYHIGGVEYGGVIRNNLAYGLGLGLQSALPFLNESRLEVYGLGSKDTNRPGYPGPAMGSGVYLKGIVTPVEGWQFFGIFWMGWDYMSEEGDGNYNSLGVDGVYYQSARNYEEAGVRREVSLGKDAYFDFELRSLWIEDSWANSFRILAQIPFELTVSVKNKAQEPALTNP